jgi:hypothetical protein
MIIRRKHTANFTTIGNRLFEDERLAADEVGILAYLLSRPNDWEVRRPALARRWGVGRDTIKRVMLNLICCGWVVARKTRLSNGTYHTVYEVRDEPGPELSLADAKAATSLVSSDADGDPAEAETDAPNPGRQNDPPGTPQPDAGQPGAANPSWPIRESLKTDSEKTESTNGARAFADVLEQWPSGHVVSPFACEQAHAALTEAQQTAACDGVKPYLEDCRAKNRKLCDLKTYYAERRWEGLSAKAAKVATAFHAEPRTPQWHRWREYYERTGGPWRFMEQQAAKNAGFTVPSEWPPAASSTGPPAAA